MAQVVLMQPSVGDMDELRDAPHLPLGLLATAGNAVERWETVLVDQRLDGNWKESLEKAIGTDTLCTAITCMSGPQVRFALEMAKEVKQLTDAPVIWGGMHPSLMPGQVLASSLADIVVRGEGEITFYELLKVLEKKRSLEGILSVSFKDGGGAIRHNESRPLANDLAGLPEPAWNLVDLDLYRPGFLDRRSLNIELSRGCTRKCAYCYNHALSRSKLRTLLPEAAAKRLFDLHDQRGVDSFYVVDDNLFLNKGMALGFAQILKECKRDIRWQSQGMDIRTILSLKHTELELLVESGLNRISVGADSGSQRILKILRKAYTVEEVLEANRKLARFPIIVYYSFLSGIPGESEEDLERTLDLMLELTDQNSLARTSPVYNYFPLPGTELWQRLIAEYGFRPPATLDEWASVDYACTNVDYLSGPMKKKLGLGYFPTLFLDRKFDEYGAPSWIKLVADFYRPVARFRVKHKFFRFPVETVLGKILRTRWST
ncbi:MAG: B12-binding domain-containing radical SAM protein [Deltaproteobacteria bacterium]|nr:B12-binding domain-containing radical SAM protein [Deltaproteobacteria bacterium]